MSKKWARENLKNLQKTFFCSGFGLQYDIFRNLAPAADDADLNELN
jgi:hypothetical protein